MTGQATSIYAGYRLHSEIKLPLLPNTSADGVRPPLLVTRRCGNPRSDDPNRFPNWRHRWLDDDDGISLQVAALDGSRVLQSAKRYLLRAPDQCDFILDPTAGTIEVAPEAGLALNTLEHLLLDQVIPRLLAGRGHLVVHASLVRFGTQAVAFLGRSGWGKSTLAALLHRHGLTALCDDCILLERQDGAVFAIPSYPGLRLYEDSIAQALVDDLAIGPVAEYSDKQRIIGLDLPPDLLEPQPLAAICLLDDPQQATDSLGLAPTTTAAACMALIEHGFRLDPSDPAQSVQQLRQASAAADAVPTFLLSHPRDFARQNALIRLLRSRFAPPKPSHD